jgi:hypothetical protein
MAISIPIISEFDGKGINKALQQFKQLETAGEKAQFAIKKAAIPATIAFGALTLGAKDAIGAASDFAESQSKVNVIFGEGAKDIEAFAKSAAGFIGQSKQAVYNAAGTFGTFGKAAGKSGKELAMFSNDFTQLASDLASFNNTTPEEAIQAIGAALRGESEPLRRYGILLDADTMKQEALAMGIHQGKGPLDAQAKILAATELIFRQSTDALGDFQETQEGMANSSRTMSAQIEDLKLSIGQSLMPVVEAIMPKVRAFAAWAAENPDLIKAVVFAVAGLTGAIVAMNIAMSLNPVSLIIIGLTTLGTALFLAYKKFDGFRKVVDVMFDGFKIGFDLVKSYFTGVLGFYKMIFNGIADLWNNTIGKLSFKVPSWVPGIGGKGFEVPNIPKLADGGIVTGPTLALIGEAGPEAVVPLDRAGGMGGVTINVNGGDPVAVVDALRRYMNRYGNIPIRTTAP